MCSNHRKDEGMCVLIRGRVGEGVFLSKEGMGKGVF